VSKQSSPAVPPPDGVAVHHHTHPDIVKRLKRAEGHVRSIVEMIEAGRPCVDIAQQLHAVEKAVSQAKRIFIHDHLDDCLEHSLGSATGVRRDAIEEFKEITKYL
jgi:DNA-binding FrmR family transcriptional regulator